MQPCTEIVINEMRLTLDSPSNPPLGTTAIKGSILYSSSMLIASLDVNSLWLLSPFPLSQNQTGVPLSSLHFNRTEKSRLPVTASS